MNFGPDMMRHQADDALGSGRLQAVGGRSEALAKPVKPEPTIGIEHDFNHGGIVEPSADARTERSMQHARATPLARTTLGQTLAERMGGTGHHAPCSSRAARCQRSNASQEGRVFVQIQQILVVLEGWRAIGQFCASSAVIGAAKDSIPTQSTRPCRLVAARLPRSAQTVNAASCRSFWSIAACADP